MSCIMIVLDTKVWLSACIAFFDLRVINNFIVFNTPPHFLPYFYCVA